MVTLRVMDENLYKAQRMVSRLLAKGAAAQNLLIIHEMYFSDHNFLAFHF